MFNLMCYPCSRSTSLDSFVYDYFFKKLLKKLYCFNLKAHLQTSKKRFSEKYCFCDKACQFSALENPEI